MISKGHSLKALSIIGALVSILLFVPGLAKAGNLEPVTGPGPTMKTLDEIPPTWSQSLPSAERFVPVLDGAGILDKETGLVWEKSPDLTKRNWLNAVEACYYKNVGGRKGWRLPTVAEMASLVDITRSNPTLPSGHPFQNVQSDYYWTSTTYEGSSDEGWVLNLVDGFLVHSGKTAFNNYVWAVRTGK